MSPDSPFSNSRNRLLAALSAEDAALIEPELTPVQLERRFVLEHAHEPIDSVYFPESGVVSMVAQARGGRLAEVGIFGWEGMSAIALVTGNTQATHSSFVQIHGEGQRMSGDALRQVMRESDTLRLSLLRFVQAFMIQTTYTALANARGKLEERLARWLLMCHDRTSGDGLRLTHEFVSTMLGVRRAGVTMALHLLEGEALIRAERGLVEILDREGLEALADTFYGVPESEYERLVGVSLQGR